MRLFKRILAILAAVLMVLLLAGFFFVQHLKPSYEGTHEMPGNRDSVTVYFDTYGIPHIYAENEADAFRALGYVHAQDRLWQMELLRRIAPGRLSEAFGEDALPNDRFFVSLGIDEASRALLANLDPGDPSVFMAEAYLEGVNRFIEEGPTPLEFYLTGLEKEPFTLTDVYNTIGYMAFSFAMAHKTDPFLMEVKDRLGMEYVSALLEESPSNTTMIRTFDQRSAGAGSHEVSAAIGKILATTPLPALEGSNSWVLGPEKTRSGKVILANDPHIGFAQPSVWYEAHLVAPGFEKYGYFLGGVPFPLLGHDRNLAYGLTMFENDDIDFYSETPDPEDSTRYKRPEGWKSFETSAVEIPVKGQPPVTFEYRKTDRGPVINGVIESLRDAGPVSMSWVYTQGDNRVLQALYGISHASDLTSFEKAVTDIHAPGLNVMYGDAEGNVAWWAAARLHETPDSLSTKLFLDGSRMAEPVELPFDQNPKAINPPWGYVYSANNQPDTTEVGLIPGYYLPENRARRIEELLAPQSDWDREGVMKMITDVTSPVNPEIAARFIDAMAGVSLPEAERAMLEALEAWNGEADLESKESVLFHRWVYQVLAHTFRDELGPEGFAALLRTHLVKRLIAPISQKDEFIWWDDITTEDRIETRTGIVQKAFRAAMASIESDFGGIAGDWGWKDVHTVEYSHPLGRVAALRSFFNVGPFPVHGTREVINNLMFPYDSTGYYRVSAGPSTRRVIDFSDPGESRSILPTGQSGNPFSPHYEDQAPLYIQGKFRKMLLDPEDIRQNSESLLIFHSKD
ncbi:MAG: penicillin acylase family protein [Robiginitalea sp.]